MSLIHHKYIRTHHTTSADVDAKTTANRLNNHRLSPPYIHPHTHPLPLRFSPPPSPEKSNFEKPSIYPRVSNYSKRGFSASTMERLDVAQTLIPSREHQTLATAVVDFQAPSPVPPTKPQTLDTSVAPSEVPELGLELSLNLTSEQIIATGNLEHEFMNFGDGGGYLIGKHVFSIVGDEGETPTQRGADLFAILRDGEEAASENVDVDAVTNSVKEVSTENVDAFMNSVDGEGAVVGSGSDAFMLFGDEEGATTGSGFDTAMFFGDDEGATPESGMKVEGATPIDRVNTDVNAENVGRANKLLVTNSIRDALDFSETDKPEIMNTGITLMNPPDVSDISNNRKNRSMVDHVIRTDLGMNGPGNDEVVAELDQGKRYEVRDSGDTDGAGMEVEGAVSTQRARNKSKCLSPPYPNPRWNEMQPALHINTYALVPWSPKKGKNMANSSLVPLSPKKGKGPNDKMSKGKGSNDKMSPSATYASVDVTVFLSDLLSLAIDHYHLMGSHSQHIFRSFYNEFRCSQHTFMCFYKEFRCSQYLYLNLGNDKVHSVDSETLARGVGDRSKVKANFRRAAIRSVLSDLLSLAVDHYHLKGSRSQRTFRSFYKEFRCSQYQCLDLRNDKVHTVDSVTLVRGVGDRSRVKATRMSISGKGGAVPKVAIPLNSNSGKGKRGSATPKKKVTKKGVDGQGQLNLVTGSANTSLGKRKANASGKLIPESTGHVLFEFSEGDTPKKRNSNGATLVETPLNSRDTSGLPEGGQMVNTRLKESNQSGQKKGSKVNKKPKSTVTKTGKGPRGSTSQQKQKIDEALSECPAALFLTFSPGSTLPSRDELVSTFSLYGDLIEHRIELLEDFYRACVVFAKGSDAEKAFNSPDEKFSFGSTLTRFRLHYIQESMPNPSVAQPVQKTPHPSPYVAQHFKKTLRPSSSVAQLVKKTPRPGRSVTQRFKKTHLPNIRKNLERLLRSLIRPFSVGQAAGTAEWMNLEGMEELVDDMKALREKIDRLLTQTTAATSH